MPVVARNENLGAAERIIQTLITHQDHLYHGRLGVVVPDRRTVVGVRWEQITYKVENDQKVAYLCSKQGKRDVRTRIGIIQPDGSIVENGVKYGDLRKAGLFPEIATWMYRQVAEVWKLDNEFAARWASFAYAQDHKDLKVILAAFLMVQSRCGEPIKEDGKVAFYDDDFRNVGEAMALIYDKNTKSLDAKLLLRIRNLLCLPGVAEINRELGFGRSARHPTLGRWPRVINKWLAYREENYKLLEGLVKAGYRRTVMKLARYSGYKPSGERFFDILRWKQVQKADGRRTISIGKAVAAAESWKDLTEEQICQKIISDKPNFKRICGMVPTGLTRAIVAAAIEANSLSDKDLIIYSPTLEELGLLQVQDIRERWEAATKAATDQRAANIATRMKGKEATEKLQEAADNAIKAAVEEVTRGMRVYIIIDVSGSMQGAIEAAKEYIAKFLQGFPEDRVHISIFNTAGREIKIQHSSAAGVANAFRGVQAGGGTDYASGIRVLAKYKPKDDEDSLMIFIGDERNFDRDDVSFEADVRTSGLNPMAFGLVKVCAHNYDGGVAVQSTAAKLGIPCFKIEKDTFNDPYAITRTIRTMIAATPVGKVEGRRQAPARVTLVDQILQTQLLMKPCWA